MMFYALPGVLTLSTTEWKDVRGKESSLLKGNQHGLKAGVLKWTDCCDLSMRSCDTQVVPQYYFDRPTNTKSSQEKSFFVHDTGLCLG